MDFFNDIFHNLALLEFYFLNIIYILLYIDFILSIFFQHSNILTRASHHWCLASNIVLVQPWFYPVVKYCFNAIYFTRFIFVNSVIVSSIISCNDLYQDFIIMYVWYFVSRNSISVLGAIWPSLSPCTVINPILLTYLLSIGCMWIHSNNFQNIWFLSKEDAFVYAYSLA